MDFRTAVYVGALLANKASREAMQVVIGTYGIIRLKEEVLSGLDGHADVVGDLMAARTVKKEHSACKPP